MAGFTRQPAIAGWQEALAGAGGWRKLTDSVATQIGGSLVGQLSELQQNSIVRQLTDLQRNSLVGQFSALSRGSVAGQLSEQMRSAVFGRGSSQSWSKFGAQAHRLLEVFRRLDEVESALDDADPMARRLSYLLRGVAAGRALLLMERLISEGSEPMIELLADVLLVEAVFDLFRRAIIHAGIDGDARGDLEHALEHLSEAEFDRAFPPLVAGLEGALRQTARARGDTRQRSNARAVVMAMDAEHEHVLIVGSIYGDLNDGRHGIDLDRRSGCVLGLVGMVIWIELALEQPAVRWLGRQIDQELHRAAQLPA